MDAERVILSLEEQVSCYRRLAKLAVMQHEYVQRGQTEELLEVLQKRQEELNQLAQLEPIVRPVSRDWDAHAPSFALDQREKAEELLRESKVLLKQIMSADQDDVLVLQQQKISVGRQINAASSARTINRNYAAAAYGTSRSNLDLKK